MFRIRNETLAANHGFFLNMVLRYMHQDTSKRYSDSGQGIVIFEKHKKRKKAKNKKDKNGGKTYFSCFYSFLTYFLERAHARERVCVFVCLGISECCALSGSQARLRLTPWACNAAPRHVFNLRLLGRPWNHTQTPRRHTRRWRVRSRRSREPKTTPPQGPPAVRSRSGAAHLSRRVAKRPVAAPGTRASEN